MRAAHQLGRGSPWCNRVDRGGRVVSGQIERGERKERERESRKIIAQGGNTLGVSEIPRYTPDLVYVRTLSGLGGSLLVDAAASFR